MLSAVTDSLIEQETEARLAGQHDEAAALEFFADMMQALRREPRIRSTEPMRAWLIRAGGLWRDESDHEKHCTCRRCPHCDEVIDDY